MAGQGIAVHGELSLGEDAGVQVITPAPGNRSYSHLYAWCSTNGARLYFLDADGGLIGEILIAPDSAPMGFPDLDDFSSVEAANTNSGQNFVNLYVVVW